VTSALTPELALAYLRELQPNLREVAIGPPGEPLAGARDAVRARSGNQEIAAVPGDSGLRKLLELDASRVADGLNR
jgi:hypothetical protein